MKLCGRHQSGGGGGGGRVGGRIEMAGGRMATVHGALLELVRPVPATRVPERLATAMRVPETQAPSDSRGSVGLQDRWTISMALGPAPRQRQVSSQVGAGSMQSALLHATRGSQEMCGGATTS